ncbi:neutral zinc metallopeptidase [Novosphingobium sp. 1949]|uniref:Neutral zinc metallopeptidase n=1 Tax=Novosphingobium organovorum TaxID=2930092 RepID=A0ABT0BC47_9SPHN|nr:neutral zinc metallopeptidase [Novosphingobium organovorum]MCJ2182630.1 neutral zinc metallopeptidase [Novosphingobium organovorum]
MRLNRFDPNNIRVQRGGAAGGGGGLGGGGKLGCGAIVIVLVGALVFGIDPSQMLGVLENVQQQQVPATQPGQSQAGQSPAGSSDAAQVCNENAYSLEACNALSSLNTTWEPVMQQAGIDFEQPTLNFFTNQTRSGCGAAQSAMGPFYCPADEGIYIDTSFYDQLARDLGAKGDFARYYVIAHEYGHHIQNLIGTEQQLRKAQAANPSQANALQVKLELQADCFAGVWAGKNRNLIEPGDMEEGMTAASAIGDDTLLRNAGQSVNPEKFTHGTSAQRMAWLKRGIESGNADACDTFNSKIRATS